MPGKHRRRGVLVMPALRYHPYFAKIRELVASGGWDTSFGQPYRFGRTRPATHSYVRGISGARAKPIRSCWPNAVTTSTSCCG
ncbi:MAG: hypothetical protein ACLRMJ_11650 [Alistipes finegoldii]